VFIVQTYKNRDAALRILKYFSGHLETSEQSNDDFHSLRCNYFIFPLIIGTSDLIKYALFYFSNKLKTDIAQIIVYGVKSNYLDCLV
jgi:hypothetical protein